MKIQQCQICGKTCQSLGTHLKYSHEDISYEEYYLKYIGETGCNVCPECGKPNIFRSLSQGFTKFCSKSCCQRSNLTNEKRKDTSEKRYGTRNYRNVEKSKQTKIEKYGKPYYNNKEKSIETKRLKTDEEWEIAKNKTIETRLNKYGAYISNESLNKTKQTKLERYGSETYNNREAAQNTCIERYGVLTPLKNKEIIEKTICHRFEKYPNYYDIEKYEATKKEKRNEFLSKISDAYNGIIIEEYYNDEFGRTCMKYKCEKCGAECDEFYQLVYKRFKRGSCLCTNCLKTSASYSADEKEIVNFVKEFKENIIENDRSVLNGKELDIYIPNKKIAIEFDGLYWHNEMNKPDDYHLWKTEECEKQGIQLIHIFEDEWLYKQEIVKSRLKGLLGHNERVFARKTECREISYEESEKFLNENHIQGNCVSKYRYGLFYNDELISVMSFGKSRFGNEFELLRFANKLCINVVGGASKLFSHFTKDHPEINEIISYADRRWSKGNLYEKLGFQKTSISDPSYFYVVKGIRENRIKYQKHKLVKEGYDPNKSEHDIMLEREIYRIYDCGNLKYKYIK